MPLNDTVLTSAGGDAKVPASKVGTDASIRVDETPKRARRSKQQRKPSKAGVRITAANGTQKLTKSGAVLKLLKSSKGTTIVAMMEATGWQVHSIRGFLSGMVKKKLGLTVESEIGKDGTRRYRILDRTKAG